MMSDGKAHTPALDRATVAKVATLARLKLTDAEIDDYVGRLGAVLEYVRVLDELDTSNVEPLVHAFEMTNVFRVDEVQPSLPRAGRPGECPQVRRPLLSRAAHYRRGLVGLKSPHSVPPLLRHGGWNRVPLSERPSRANQWVAVQSVPDHSANNESNGLVMADVSTATASRGVGAMSTCEGIAVWTVGVTTMTTAISAATSPHRPRRWNRCWKTGWPEGPLRRGREARRRRLWPLPRVPRRTRVLPKRSARWT